MRDFVAHDEYRSIVSNSLGVVRLASTARDRQTRFVVIASEAFRWLLDDIICARLRRFIDTPAMSASVRYVNRFAADDLCGNVLLACVD